MENNWWHGFSCEGGVNSDKQRNSLPMEGEVSIQSNWRKFVEKETAKYEKRVLAEIGGNASARDAKNLHPGTCGEKAVAPMPHSSGDYQQDGVALETATAHHGQSSHHNQSTKTLFCGKKDQTTEAAVRNTVETPKPPASSQSVVNAGVVETGTVQTGTVQTGTVQTGIVKTGTVQTGIVKTGIVKTGIAKTSIVETGIAKTGVVETGPTSKQKMPEAGSDSNARPASLAQIEMLRRFPVKAWHRPKRSTEGWDVSTDGSELALNVCRPPPGTVAHADIRSEIAKTNHLQAANGHNLNDPWGEVEDGDCDDEDFLLSRVYYEKYIDHWIADVRPLKEPLLFMKSLGDKHIHYDIDPADGAIKGPIVQPHTIQNNEGVDESVVWRAHQLCSSLLIFRELAIRRKKEESRIKQRQQEAMEKSAATQAARDAARIEATSIKPQAPCVFRPATPEDMQGAVDVYNKEVETGRHAIDMKPLSVDDMTSIFKTCEAEKLPFIVCVYEEEPSIEAFNFPTEEARREYFEFRQWKESQKSRGKEDEKGKVLGFTFSTEFAVGLAGHREGLSRFSAKISLFVHPAYRNKKIGKVLLNQMLSLHSSRYFVEPGYRWEEGSSPGVYGERHLTPRNLHQLYIQGIYLSDSQDETLEWHEKFFGRYEFEQAARIKKCFRGKSAEWLDMIIWVHHCQPTAVMAVKHLRL